MRRLALAVGSLLLVVAACGDDSAGSLPFGSTSTTTTAAATTLTTATTVATTLPATTATTATTAPPPTLGPPPLPPVDFRPEGIGFALFGASYESVIATAERFFGPPTTDSGWLPGGFGDYGVCPGTRFRQVYFLGDTLLLMFSDADFFVGGGADNFIHYQYTGTTPITAGPPASIDVGVTVADALAIWPGAVVAGDDPLFGNVFSYDPGTGYEYLFAQLTGTTPADTIVHVSGGVGCGE